MKTVFRIVDRRRQYAHHKPTRQPTNEPTRGRRRRLLRVLRMQALHVALEPPDGGQRLPAECARGLALVHLHVLEQRAPVGVRSAAEPARETAARRGAGRGRPVTEARRPGGGLAGPACNRAARLAQLIDRRQRSSALLRFEVAADTDIYLTPTVVRSRIALIEQPEWSRRHMSKPKAITLCTV